jgi:hypothetical protein
MESRPHLLALVPLPLFSLQCQKFFTAVLLRPGSSSLAMAAHTPQQQDGMHRPVGTLCHSSIKLDSLLGGVACSSIPSIRKSTQEPSRQPA